MDSANGVLRGGLICAVAVCLAAAAGAGQARAQTASAPAAGAPAAGGSGSRVKAVGGDDQLAEGELEPESDPSAFDDPNQDPGQGEPQADPQYVPRRSVFPSLAFPFRAELAAARKKAFDDYGLTFGLSYSQLAQWATETVPGAQHDSALGAWITLSITWAPVDRGGDYQGQLVFRPAFRGSLGDNAVPAQFGPLDQGSLWSNYEFTSWNNGVRVEDLFWEQRVGPRFSFRIGNMGPQAVFNFFRFKDARTGFTSSPFAFNETIPYPTFGFGASFRWLPLSSDPTSYIVGTINDMNGDPADHGLDWGTVGKGQFFYGLEIGKDWRRDNGEFDHLHLDLFYADKRSTRNPDTTPNTAGGGFKIAGEKQIGSWVAFANYTYNTARGGGISTSFSRDMATTGFAYLRPFGVPGEVAAGAVWGQSFANLFAPNMPAKDQYGVETYWNVVLTPNWTFTPGVSFIWNPAFNPTARFGVIPSLKFRIFL